MKVSSEYYDEVFPFKGQWDMPSACGLRVLRGEGRALVIVTELYQDNPGTSVTNAGRSLAEQICAARGLDPASIRYLECNPDAGSKLSFYDEAFFEVDFSGERPQYRQVPPAELAALFREYGGGGA